MTLGARDVVPPAMLAVAVVLGGSGALDRPGLEGLSDGLLIGAAVCAPIWVLGLWRRRRAERDGAG